jgi:hypothetical protein
MSLRPDKLRAIDSEVMDMFFWILVLTLKKSVNRGSCDSKLATSEQVDE